MKGPSIAVMLGGKPDDDAEGEKTELSLGEAKAAAADAARSFAQAIEDKDPAKIVKAFTSLSTLCAHVEELEESGETEDKEEERDDSDSGEEG